MSQRDKTAEAMLERLGDLENYPEENLTAYKEFALDGEIYYLTSGGFLYRKEPGRTR
jgi:hypothetical protein